MGLFDRFKKAAQATQAAQSAAPAGVEANAASGVVCAPVSGRVVAMKDVPDPVFSSEALGPGCGIWPDGEMVYAPATGTVSVMMGHAMGIVSDDGVEVLVHVGLDTVDMNGKGFTPYAKKNDHVSVGQPILGFSRKEIADSGHKDVVILAVTNGASYGSVDLIAEPDSSVAVGEQVVRAS